MTSRTPRGWCLTGRKASAARGIATDGAVGNLDCRSAGSSPLQHLVNPSMDAFVRSLRDVRATDVAEVGGKAASLGDLLAAGIRVPEGIVVTVADGDGASGRPSLEDAVAGLGAGPFAVRSSGIAEDGADRSFAGMYESLLDVTSADVPRAVEQVLASASGERVARYGGEGDGRIAVIVQRMVAATAAGVALTADPISGDRRTRVVTAVRGTGDRLVSGAVIGDEWRVRDGARRRAGSRIA